MTISGNNNNTTIHNGNITNINVTFIRNYDEPNLDYINEKHYCKYMRDMNTAYLNMYKEIYKNPKYPENKSIKKTNKKDKFIEYYKDGKWNIGNIDTLLPEIKEILYEAFDKGSNDDKLYELIHKLETEKEFKLKVDRDIIASSLP